MKEYANGLLVLKNEQLILKTKMKGRVFAQAKLSDYLKEKGCIARLSSSNTWSFESWSFDGTLLEKEEINVYGKAFDGIPLSDLLEQDSHKAIAAIGLIAQALKASYDNKTPIKYCIPPAILMGKDTTILFLPQTLFTRAALSLSKESYARSIGSHSNPSLKKDEGDFDIWNFTLSSLLYTALKGKIPYDEIDDEKRAEDLFDSAYIPLFYDLTLDTQKKDCEQAKKALKAIDYNLSLNAPLKNTKKSPAKSTLISRESIEALEKVGSLQKNKKASQQFFEKQKKALKRKRFFRHHGLSTTIIAVIVIFTSFFALSIIKGNLVKPTTKGLNEEEVVELFYTAINTLDTELIDSTGESAAIKGFSDSVSTIFVTQKIRQAYEHTPPFFTPQQWPNTAKPLEFSMYGITNLVVVPQDKSNGIPFFGKKAHFTTEYYLIHSNGAHEYTVTKMYDKIELSYTKKHFWYITDIESITTPIPIDSVQFSHDAQKILSTLSPKTRGVSFVRALKKDYPWLPCEEAVRKAKKEVLNWIELEGR